MEKQIRSDFIETSNEVDEYLDILIKEHQLPLQESRSRVTQAIQSRDHVSTEQVYCIII